MTASAAGGRRPASHTAPLAAFFALGVFWGVWGAIMPAVAGRVAGGDDAALGAALLCVAIGAVPAMLAAGRLSNRFARDALAPSVAAFGLAAALPALAGDVPTLAVILVVVGAASGGLDVVMNAAAAGIEAARRIRLMHLAHAAFSAGVFVAAVAAGLARDAGVPYQAILVAAAGLILVLALVVHRTLPPSLTPAAPLPTASQGWGLTGPLMALGGLCGLAYLADNGLQLWSALHLERTLGAGPAVGGLGPGLLAASAVAGRLAGQGLAVRLGDRALLSGAGVAAALGALGFALAPAWPLALASLVLAGASLAIASPTLFALAGRWAAPERRGSAVSLVAVLGYLGFLIGPGLLGGVSSTLGLRAAIALIAAVALVFGLLAGLLVARAAAGGAAGQAGTPR